MTNNQKEIILYLLSTILYLLLIPIQPLLSNLIVLFVGFHFGTYYGKQTRRTLRYYQLKTIRFWQGRHLPQNVQMAR